MRTSTIITLMAAILAGGMGLSPRSSSAQSPTPISEGAPSENATADDPRTLTLQAAVRTALKSNHDLQLAELDIQEADEQVREAWGNLYPSLDLTGSYTRNLKTANPFAGSGAADLTGGGNQTDWLAFNERRELEGNDRISFREFQQRQQDSLAASGASFGGGGNPFSVDNEFRAGLQLTQTIYNKQAFASVKGSKQFKEVNRHARDRAVQTTTNEVVTAFYNALLAREQVRVRRQRVTRAKETFREVAQQVRRGVTAKAQRLGAEVELSNAQTQMIQARNDAERARDHLKQTIGLSPGTPVALEGELEKQSDDGLQTISEESLSMPRAVDQAMENRPDLKRARLNVELRGIQKEASRSEFYPRVQAVANFSYSGRVPDSRSRVETDNPNSQIPDPFFFQEEQRGFFSSDFWNPSLSAGLELSWNLFNGFQSSSRLQQAEIRRRRAKTQLQQLRDAVAVQVRRAVRNLENARERIAAQETTVRRAEQNYDHVAARVQEGASRAIELREASDQLDQSRLSYLQAVHDYLVARSDLETALGQPLTPTSESYLMTRR